jgi:sugar/nucleoside kinase (ribokinase family)
VLQYVRDLAKQCNIPSNIYTVLVDPTADWHCAKLLESGIVNDTFILCPNYKELLILSQTPDSSEVDIQLAKECAAKLRSEFPGLQHLVIKLGSKGVLYISDSYSEYIPVPPVARVSNSFGAGDTFMGALGAGYLETSDMISSIHKAVTAASQYLATNK